MEGLNRTIMLIPKADGLGALILTGYPEGCVVLDGPTGEVLSDTRIADQSYEGRETK